ncbi:hypothetical protein FRX31_029973 [Thalictrum thalictroides]|uniref:Uncharacterized protein n=1 Tax=Thalictrum thalictroides TaxID=46969 RepID=A0A7J6V6B5_THATH|nr:hypothetical protein FRX31_029973 [Thalictrum thalictroides]
MCFWRSLGRGEAKQLVVCYCVHHLAQDNKTKKTMFPFFSLSDQNGQEKTPLIDLPACVEVLFSEVELLFFHTYSVI